MIPLSYRSGSAFAPHLRLMRIMHNRPSGAADALNLQHARTSPHVTPPPPRSMKFCNACPVWHDLGGRASYSSPDQEPPTTPETPCQL